MGKVNDQFNFYLSNPDRLADFFNGIVYGGQRRILPQDLADIQKCYQEPLPDRYGRKKTHRRERDAAKLLCQNGHFILLAVENQNQINYCMPLRCAEYDLTDLDENIFETDLREVIGMAKRKGDKEALQRYCEDHADRLCSLAEDAYDLVCALLNQKTLTLKKESCYNAETEDLNMCKAMEDWAKEEREKGKKEGKKEGEKQGEEKLSALIQRLAKDNRMDDILKAANSVRVRRRLYQEYSL